VLHTNPPKINYDVILTVAFDVGTQKVIILKCRMLQLTMYVSTRVFQVVVWAGLAKFLQCYKKKNIRNFSGFFNTGTFENAVCALAENDILSWLRYRKPFSGICR
jgi:hypothetical protein